MADKHSERKEIARDGGRGQKNSGRGKIQKGDAILGPFCYDIKEYEKSFSISQDVWAKTCEDAFNSGKGSKVPALKLVLGDPGEKRTRLWVVGELMFDEMLEAWQEKYDKD